MNRYSDLINLISNRLYQLSEYTECSYSILLEAQQYSLTAGGKHLRGLLLLQTASLGGVDVNNVLDYACALEMVHTYSLVHDDLPEMDNDDLRRGKPTCHKKYGSDIALLAGDALLTKAFNIIAKDTFFNDSIKIDCIRILSDCCGEHGMLAGQTIDKKSENKIIDLSKLEELQSRKTGDMFEAAVKIGAILGSLNKDVHNSLLEYIKNMGLAFQIKDDILDVMSTSDVLGKPVLSDNKCKKSTFVSIFGLEKSNQLLLDKIQKAKKAVEKIDNPFYNQLADYFVSREK